MSRTHYRACRRIQQYFLKSSALHFNGIIPEGNSRQCFSCPIALSCKQIVLSLGVLAPRSVCHSSPSGLDHIGNLLTRPLTRTEIHPSSHLRQVLRRAYFIALSCKQIVLLPRVHSHYGVSFKPSAVHGKLSIIGEFCNAF